MLHCVIFAKKIKCGFCRNRMPIIQNILYYRHSISVSFDPFNASPFGSIFFFPIGKSTIILLSQYLVKDAAIFTFMNLPAKDCICWTLFQQKLKSVYEFSFSFHRFVCAYYSSRKYSWIFMQLIENG